MGIDLEAGGNSTRIERSRQDKKMSASPKPRPKYYDLNLAHLPPPGLVSIFHRVSGALLFFPILPVALISCRPRSKRSGLARWNEFFDTPAR